MHDRETEEIDTGVLHVIISDNKARDGYNY